MEDKLVTDADVYAHVESIPDHLAKCVTEHHEWTDYDWRGFNANGGVVRKPENAVSIDVTRRCARCDMLKTCTLTIGRHGPVDRTEWSYSRRNRDLVSPAGISQTGISVRRELGMTKLWEGIVQAPIPLRGAKESKTARRGAA